MNNLSRPKLLWYLNKRIHELSVDSYHHIDATSGFNQLTQLVFKIERGDLDVEKEGLEWNEKAQ